MKKRPRSLPMHDLAEWRRALARLFSPRWPGFLSDWAIRYD